MILLFRGVVVEYPITVLVDNVRYILLSEKASEYQWMKHIDARHNFIFEYVEDGTAKIKSFHTEGNIAFLFTKNLCNGPIESLTSWYVHRE